MYWNSLCIVVFSAVLCVLLDFGPSRVLADGPIYEGNTTVMEGDPFKVTCRVSMFDVIKWQKDGHPLNLENFNITENVINSIRVSSISANSASTLYSGQYRCTTQFNMFLELKVVTAEMIKPNYDFGDNYKAGDYKTKLTLQCNIEGNQDGKFSWKWLKGDKEITSDTHIDVSDNSLIVNRFLESDVGKYTCKLYKAADKNKELEKKEFNVVMKPYVKLAKTTTFMEGEEMRLECTVFGVPTPEVSWKFENTTIVTSENISFIPNQRNISNAILVMKSINMKNRGNFYCLGKNNVFVDPIVSAPSYVRIKDKMAALWPFLGICAEVIILCLIIFIYEKKRNKAEFEESDTDQGPETNNANDHSGGEVRHRK